MVVIRPDLPSMEETGPAGNAARRLLARRRWLCLSICALAVTLVGAALRPQQARAEDGLATEGPDQLRSLGTLVARGHRLRIDLGPLGPIYTLTDEGGTFIDSDADPARLSGRHPHLGLDRRLSNQGDGMPLMMVIDRE